MRKFIISVAALVSSTAYVYAGCLDEVSTFAAKVCGEIEREGESGAAKIGGDINAKANGIVTRFIGSLSGTIDVEASKDYYIGVARDQLASDRISARDCAKEMARVALTVSCRPSNPAQGTNFVKIDRPYEVVTTGNHHCERNCRGEPTRTGYRAVLKAPVSPEGRKRRLTNPILECIAGPCAFSHVTGSARIANDGQTARADFDVWSKPMSWKISADLEELQ